jgi:hypothetical protein
VSALADSISDLEANPRQWEAFTAKGNCVVLAPPGSGKTKLLTTRMAHDLLTSVPPHGAACITLTNAAAAELRRRVDHLGVPPRSTLFVGTVHAFALRQVLIPFAAMLGLPQYAAPEFISDNQRNELIESAIAGVFGRHRRREPPMAAPAFRAHRTPGLRDGHHLPRGVRGAMRQGTGRRAADQILRRAPAPDRGHLPE